MIAATLNRKLAAETLGTAFLLATVVGSGIMAAKLAGGNIALALLGKLKLLVHVSAVSEAEIQSALSASFKDFEDAIQHFAAKAEGGVSTCCRGRRNRRSRRNDSKFGQAAPRRCC